MTQKTLGDFENAHGGSKIRDLEHKLEIEREKVRQLADIQNVLTVEHSKDNCIRFAVTSDRHTGSLYHLPKVLEGFYDHLRQEGITQVFDAGDILDGHKVYKGHEFELLDLGLDAQLTRLAQAPDSVETMFITGNHDASFKSAAGIPVGRLIELTKNGKYKFLGEGQARYRWETPNGPYELMLSHPGGGTAYSLSYRPQKIAEALEGGTKPNMLVVGHYHKSEVIPSYRNITIIQAGTFQSQTPFMAERALAAHVGGWIVEVWVGGNHNRVRTEFVPVYVEKDKER